MTILISALQRNAAEVIRRVTATGMAEEITDRGRVVAVLSPAPRESGISRLRNAGIVREATKGSLANALNTKITLDGISEALNEQRDSDR